MEVAEPCIEIHRITRLEKDVEALENRNREQDAEITRIRENQIEYNVHLKLVLDMMSEFKVMLKENQKYVETSREMAEANNQKAIDANMIARSKTIDVEKEKRWIEFAKYIIGGTIVALIGIFGLLVKWLTG